MKFNEFIQKLAELKFFEHFRFNPDFLGKK